MTGSGPGRPGGSGQHPVAHGDPGRATAAHPSADRGTGGPADPELAAPAQRTADPGTCGIANPGLAATAQRAADPLPGSTGPPGIDASASSLPPRSRGVIGLLEENCTVCMLCARECPDWCIYIESHKQTAPAPEGGRPRVRNVLDRFAIDFSLCMYCGICVEVCPYDALFWSPEFGYPEADITALTHEQDRLREWMWTVPPPPAHDAGAPLPREAQVADPGMGAAAEPH